MYISAQTAISDEITVKIIFNLNILIICIRLIGSEVHNDLFSNRATYLKYWHNICLIQM